MHLPVLSFESIVEIIKRDDHLVVDTRPAAQFGEGFIAGSVYMSPDQPYPVTFHSIFPEKIPVALIIGKGANPQSVAAALNGSGLINITGYYESAGTDWPQTGFDMVISIEPDELAMDIPFDDNLVLIDVRSATEFAEGHLKGAQHLALEDMGDVANIALIPENANVYLYCSNGKRSMTAASLLKIQGIHNIRVVMAAWEIISTTTGLTTEKTPEKLN